MTGKEDMYRAAAIRALCRITDSGMLQAIERYMKQVSSTFITVWNEKYINVMLLL